MPYPCIGPSNSVRRTSRSSVPGSRSGASIVCRWEYSTGRRPCQDPSTDDGKRLALDRSGVSRPAATISATDEMRTAVDRSDTRGLLERLLLPPSQCGEERLPAPTTHMAG